MEQSEETIKWVCWESLSKLKDKSYNEGEQKYWNGIKLEILEMKKTYRDFKWNRCINHQV